MKPFLPSHSVVAVSCGSESEAYFIAGMLNSSPSFAAAAAYIVLHPSPHIMDNIAIPRFKETDIVHKRIAELSRQCHTATGNETRLMALEADLDEAAAEIWGITPTELKAIQNSRP